MYFLLKTYFLLLLSLIGQTQCMQHSFVEDLVKQYQTMPQKERNQLKNKHTSCDLYTNNINYLTEMAKTILCSYHEDDYIIALGQSGSYPVIIAKMLNIFLGEKRKFGFAPFPGMKERKVENIILQGQSSGHEHSQRVWGWKTPEHFDFYDLLQFF